MIIRGPNPVSSLSFLRFTTKPTPQFPHTIFSSQLCTSSANSTAPTSSQTLTSPPNHPWPEWITFVTRLNSLGYFPKSSSSSSDAGVVPESNYGEIDVFKDPCLSFSRDRYDLFRSLSKGDIKSMVEDGCPKLQRKVVNSAKRLRVYVGLEEKSVCNTCSLRGSCDRAYVILGTSEGDARMVDVMRLLLSYALDPQLISGAVSAPSIEQAESASRRLLRLLIDSSEASTGPPRETIKKLAYKKEQSVNSVSASKGDWSCPKCSFMNFWRNIQCRKCNEEGPRYRKRASFTVEMKKGDWKCLKCECVNFASRRDCFQCKDPRPPRVLEPGEWECFKCDFLNFRRNITCHKCGSKRRNDTTSQDKIQNNRTNLVADQI